jgi:hypothetical protein
MFQNGPHSVDRPFPSGPNSILEPVYPLACPSTNLGCLVKHAISINLVNSRPADITRGAAQAFVAG